MTNKEAATIVERIRYYMEGGECWAPTEFEAMDMAIESLNRQDIPDINVSDMIYRQMAIDAILEQTVCDTKRELVERCDANISDENGWLGGVCIALDTIEDLPSAQPNLQQTCNQLATDYISRQAAIDALNGIINRFEQILRDIRESKVDDSVCGMCEYDGAFVGQSGDWCNECPGFEKDDCFRLSDECRKRWLESVELPSAQPEPERFKSCKNCIHLGHGYMMPCKNCRRNQVMPDWYEVET